MTPTTCRPSSVCHAVLFAALAFAALGADPGRVASDRLIRQLGSDSYDEREAASAALKAMGEAALPTLLQALGSPDPEVRQRAATLLRGRGNGDVLMATVAKATDPNVADELLAKGRGHDPFRAAFAPRAQSE